jgi:GDPmannose 4,6-dehydratase
VARTALITGITGQDGRYALDLLAGQGYRVIGTSRDPLRAATALAGASTVKIERWDGCDETHFATLLKRYDVHEVYNFNAYSSGAGMYDDAVHMGAVNGLGVASILEAIRKTDPTILFCQASSSELFGDPVVSPQNEDTPFNPRSPYGAAKLYAHSMIRIYRERYGLFACSAILFNHESPYRGEHFVTRKITRLAAEIKLGLSNDLALGNLNARRDWGFAGDFVRAMWLMLRADVAEDYVIATGVTHSVADLCEIAFRHLALDYRDFLRIDERAARPAEPLQLVGDPSKAKALLGWSPQVGFQELIEMMVDFDVQRLSSHDKLGRS